MEDSFKIHIDELRGRESERIEGAFDPSFLVLDEDDELKFVGPVVVDILANFVDGMLVLRMSAEVLVELPCSMCNEVAQHRISIKDVYGNVSEEQILGGIYDCSEMLREELLLQVPQFVECCGGHCPYRAEMEKYMRRVSPEEG